MIPAGKMRWPAIWVDRKNHALYARRKMALKKFAPFVSFPAFWKPSVRTQQFARRQRFEFISFEHSSCPFCKRQIKDGYFLDRLLGIIPLFKEAFS
ncbi:hypothetical protein, partial [uncultured Allobaculum sp.]